VTGEESGGIDLAARKMQHARMLMGQLGDEFERLGARRSSGAKRGAMAEPTSINTTTTTSSSSSSSGKLDLPVSTGLVVIPISDLRIGECLGSGSFAKVYAAQWKAPSSELKVAAAAAQACVRQGEIEVAVKRLVLSPLATTEKNLELFRSEVYLMSRLHHANIVPFLGVCSRPLVWCQIVSSQNSYQH
jgi:serine/threonine protein kinase